MLGRAYMLCVFGAAVVGVGLTGSERLSDRGPGDAKPSALLRHASYSGHGTVACTLDGEWTIDFDEADQAIVFDGTAIWGSFPPEITATGEVDAIVDDEVLSVIVWTDEPDDQIFEGIVELPRDVASHVAHLLNSAELLGLATYDAPDATPDDESPENTFYPDKADCPGGIVLLRRQMLCVLPRREGTVL